MMSNEGLAEAPRDAARAGGTRPGEREDAADRAPAVPEALKELLIEATLLHWHVAAASRALRDDGDLTNAQVSILRTLHADGPQTVPQLAAERSIARQPVQRCVDELAGQGFLRLAPNPRHKRSSLVTLTSAGRRRLTQMERRQSSWLRPMADGLSERALRRAARLLRRIRERIATHMNDTAPERG